MSDVLAYYVTGHGFGHARRAGEVMRAMLALRPDLTIQVRSSAPAWLFDNIGPQVHCTSVAIDSGAVEKSAVSVDAEATLRAAAAVVAQSDAIVARESAWVGSANVGRIVADAPWLAGPIARKAGVEYTTVGNFLWDWIYAPYAQERPEFRYVIDAVREGYGQTGRFLRLPFSHETDLFGAIIDTPLVSRRATRSPESVLERLGITSNDSRPRILVGMRGGMEASALAAAAADPEYLFLYPEPIPVALPAAVRPVALGPDLSFIDVLSACDVCLGKFGYGLVADCIATRVPLLWARRQGFREDELFEAQAPAWLACREIPAGDFSAGRWSRHLADLVGARAPAPPRSLDGAEFCARKILGAG